MAEKVVRRLGDRLDHLFQWINSTDAFDCIWDVCCDHGRLGLHLHKRYPSAQIHLVDKVPVIIDKLTADFGHLNDGRLHFKTADACELEIGADTRTLVIIAGVGGQNVIKILEGILSRVKVGQELDFILSPNSHMFELRAYLRAQAFYLIDEEFVGENGFCHEHLWLRYFKLGETKKPVFCESKLVSIVGNKLWQDMTELKREYIRKLLHHYQSMQVNRESTLAVAAINAYRPLV